MHLVASLASSGEKPSNLAATLLIEKNTTAAAGNELLGVVRSTSSIGLRAGRGT
jgi:hypothetical protein